MIAERTKDKMSAARKKGKFVGGTPVLGYDLDPHGAKLLVNPAEAAIVRELFILYHAHQGLLAVVKAARTKGWTTKSWVTRDGAYHPGTPLNRSSLHRLLTNVTYLGKVKYQGTVYDGEHEAIVDPELFEEVQAILQGQAVTHGQYAGNSSGALLKGVLRCGHCQRAMIPSASYNHGRKYRYYTCHRAQQHGVDQCPTRGVPAAELERFVVERLRSLAQDPHLLRDVVARAQQEQAIRMPALETELTTLREQLQERQRAGQRLATLISEEPASGGSTLLTEQLLAIEGQIDAITRRLDAVRAELRHLKAMAVSEDVLTHVLSLFDPVWDVLYPTEQARIVRLLIEQVDYNGATGTLGITFRPTGIAALQDELQHAHQQHGADQ